MSGPGGRTWLINFPSTRTQSQARAYCQSQGGDLLTIKSEADTAAIQDALNKFGEAYLWIGIQAAGEAITSAPNAWRVLTTNQSLTYSKLVDNPYYGPTDWPCAAHNTWDGSWLQWECDMKNGVACQLGEFLGCGVWSAVTAACLCLGSYNVYQA